MADRMNEPGLHRRRLRAEVRHARETANLTQRDVARAMDWSLSKLIRIETGTVGITTNDLRALLNHYGIRDQERIDALLETARKARERSWWSTYRDVASPELITMLGYESSASYIRNFESLLVPGLLQTEEYAHELFKFLRGPKNPRRLDALVELRLERQELFTRPNPPELHFVIDEAVLRRRVGGYDVMKRQLERLLEATALSHVTLRVMPFAHGMYRGLRVPYMLFEYEDPADDNILYLEYPDREVVLVEEENPDEEESVPTPAVYLEIFWELEQSARAEDAPGLIQAAIDSLALEWDGS